MNISKKKYNKKYTYFHCLRNNETAISISTLLSFRLRSSAISDNIYKNNAIKGIKSSNNALEERGEK